MSLRAGASCMLLLLICQLPEMCSLLIRNKFVLYAAKLLFVTISRERGKPTDSGAYSGIATDTSWQLQQQKWQFQLGSKGVFEHVLSSRGCWGHQSYDLLRVVCSRSVDAACMLQADYEMSRCFVKLCQWLLMGWSQADELCSLDKLHLKLVSIAGNSENA